MLIISAFYEETDLSRPNLTRAALRSSYHTSVLTASFQHSVKARAPWRPDDVQVVRVPKYTTNRSAARLWSHAVFGFGTLFHLARERYSLLYICMPPNLAALVAVVMARATRTPCVVDVVDVWPSPLWRAGGVRRLALGAWGWLGRQAVRMADRVVVECDLYRGALPARTLVTIPLAKMQREAVASDFSELEAGTLRIAYLGSFGQNYDFVALVEILRLVTRWRVILEVIGAGEMKAEVLQKVSDAGIEVNDHGVLYDEAAKGEILSRCSLGFNGYVAEAFVGLSYKMVDYLSFGLGLINNLGSDAWHLVESEQIGVNYAAGKAQTVAEWIDACDGDEIREVRKRAFTIFQTRYSYDAFQLHVNALVQELRGGALEDLSRRDRFPRAQEASPRGHGAGGPE